ncbi:MAG TPA: purine-nucleoside phosphorylase [Actinomycetota bacterium]|jgi:purine-nucleoside phosphorylase
MTPTPEPVRRPSPPDTLAEQAEALVRERTSIRPRVAVVLGSGLGDALMGDVEPETEFVFTSLPGFPASTVPGHAGRLILGTLYGVPGAVFAGRVHLYEGHGIGSTTLIPRLAAALGAGVLVLTNASGGLRATMRAGDLMLITDHLNQMGANPLAGWRFPDGQPAFVGLAHVYDHLLLEAARSAAGRAGVPLLDGVYAAVSGPSYETPAETEALARLGADAVGMSTVPEAVAAVALGLRVLGISCITDVAGADVTHEEVLTAAAGAAEGLRAILKNVLTEIGPLDAK